MSAKKAKGSSSSKIILEIGTNSINVIEAQYARNKVKIKNAYKIKGTNKFVFNKDITNLVGLVELIVKSFEESGVKGNKIVLTFPSKALNTKFSVTPLMTPKELKEYVKMDFGESFPGNNEKSHCMDYTSFGDVTTETDSNTTLLLASIPKIVVNNIIKEFKKYGYKVEDIDTPLTPMYYVSTMYEDDYENNTKMVVDIGYTGVKMMLIHLNTPVFIREGEGIGAIIDYVRKNIDIPLNVLEDLIEKVGLNRDSVPMNVSDMFDSLGLSEDDYFDELDRAAGQLINDIVKSKEYFALKLNLTPTNIILMGGGSLIKGLPEMIEQYTKINTEIVEVISSVSTSNYTLTNVSNMTLDSSYGHSIGLVLKGAIK